MDRYNAAVELTLPHDTPIGQQDRTFLRSISIIPDAATVCRASKIPYTIIQEARSILRATLFILCLMLVSVSLIPLAMAESDSGAKNKPGASQGLTIDEISRGLKSAARNIEEEIPKIGPAIGKTFKQITGTGKDAAPTKEPIPPSRPKK
ncbi:MAG: hypothetical protein QM771_18805 [Nitrospira sp.]